MSPPVTAREALVAEAIGDLTQLLERAEALQLRLAEVQTGLEATGAELGQQLDTHRKQLQQLGDQSRARTAAYIAQKADEAAKRVVEVQARAMADAGRSAVLGPSGADVDARLRKLRRDDRAFLIGLITVSAVLGAVLASVLTVVMLRG